MELYNGINRKKPIKMNSREQQQLKVSNFVNSLASDYDIEEVSSDTQLKNGTRMFKYKDEYFGVYKSGMVRKYFRTRFNQLSCYQINPTRKRKEEYMQIEGNNLIVKSYESTVRVPIIQELARLAYLKNYLIKNRGLKKEAKKIIIVNGIKYIRYDQ